MPNTKTWRDKATTKAITTKINRKKSPITSFAGLAMEFGAPVYPSYSGGGDAASPEFRSHVREQLGRQEVFA